MPYLILHYVKPQEAKKEMAIARKVNMVPVEEKAPDDEPLVYANKQVIVLGNINITEYCCCLY